MEADIQKLGQLLRMNKLKVGVITDHDVLETLVERGAARRRLEPTADGQITWLATVGAPLDLFRDAAAGVRHTPTVDLAKLQCTISDICLFATGANGWCHLQRCRP